MEDLYAEGCIRTHSGIYVNVFEPKPEMFCIEDIAHALAHQPRFGGHLPQFYSVAQHSVMCLFSAKQGGLDKLAQFDCLMHDCSEAYLMDLPKPIKEKIPQYKEIEDNLMKVLADVFHFNYPLRQTVKSVDAMMLQVEWENLMLADNHQNSCWAPSLAKAQFLHNYKTLRG